MNKKKVTALILAGAVFMAGTAQAVPISVNTWYTFGFGTTGSALTGGEQAGAEPVDGSVLILDAPGRSIYQPQAG